VQNLFRLQFLAEQHNLIFLGTVGLGKTHLATALGYAACLKGYNVRFATTVEVINALAAAQRAVRFPPATAPVPPQQFQTGRLPTEWRRR